MRIVCVKMIAILAMLSGLTSRGAVTFKEPAECGVPPCAAANCANGDVSNALSCFPDGARVAFFGDSITANGGAVMRIAAHYKKMFPRRDVRFFNCGISGGGIAAAEMYFDKVLAARKPTHVVLAFGVNDYSELDGFRQRYAALVEHIQSLGVKVVLRCATPYNEFAEGSIAAEAGRDALHRRIAEEIQSVAREKGLPCLDDYARMKNRLETGEDVFSKDRLHPNDRGQWRMAETLLAAQGMSIEPWLSREEAAKVAGLEKWDDANKRIAAVNSFEWLRIRDESLGIAEKLAKAKAWLENDGAKPTANPYIVSIARDYLRDKPHERALYAEIDKALNGNEVVDRSAMSEKYWSIWNAEEQKKIDEGIETNRKADGVFALPVSDGTEVEVEQIDHEFRFGANIFNFNQLGSKDLNDRYKAMFGDGGIFNQATVPFYWREYEPIPGVVRDGMEYEDSEEYWNSKSRAEAIKDFRWRRPAPAPIIEFCRERGLTVYGHVLIYGAVAGFPPWMWYHCCPPEERFAFRNYGITQGSIPSGTVWASMWKDAFSALGEDGVAAKCPKFAANARRVFKLRVESVAARFGDVVDSWECTNESWQDWVASGRKCRTRKPIIKSENYAIMPGDYQLNAFLDAMASLPKSAKLNINDNKMCPEYRDMVKDLIVEGARVDVVGCQMHVFNTNFISRLAAGDVNGLSCAGIQPWTPESIRAGLDMMAGAGRPLHVSEITIPAPGADAKSRMIQAIATRNFYRACFSHKSVVGITWWNLVDGGGYAGEPEVSGLMTKDLERKPAYDALDELINHEWKTKAVVCAKGGKVAFRGFRGKYRLSWKCAECGQRHSRYVTLSGDGAKEDSGAWECALCRPTALSFVVDGKRVALGAGESVLDIKKIYPDAVIKGREGEKWAKVEFDIVAPHDGEYSLEIHNDFYGELSVNGGEVELTQGPWNGFDPKTVLLRKGANHIVFRTRSGSGGNWTVGFRMPRSSGASFKSE